MDISSLLEEGRGKFSDGGTDLVNLDVEVLLAYTLGVSREYLAMNPGEDAPDPDAELYRGYLARRVAGEPVAYIVGGKEFYGMDFVVDKRVLIPRPETEMIVDEALAFIQAMGEEARGQILDVGTGSLCIAASILVNAPGFYAHAVDISDDALEVARINREYHGLEERVEIYQSDLLANVDEKAFDVIVANLPYIGRIENDTATENVKKFEPGDALYGQADVANSDGLELYKLLVQQLREKEVGFNLLIGEFGAGQEEAVSELLSKYFVHYEIKKDLAGIPRIFVVRQDSV
jgi:release factor glutamine methyltransferase